MKLRKLIALVLSVFVMAAFAAVPSFAATDVSSWLEKNVTVGAGDPADINARNTTGTRTLKKVWQTFRYTQEAHPISGQGCFSITKGVLKQKGKTCDIYLVAAHGLETNAFGQNDDMESVMKAGRQQNSPYLKQFMAVIKQTVPKGANLILTGHSLGGMVSQQAAANKTMHILQLAQHLVAAVHRGPAAVSLLYGPCKGAALVGGAQDGATLYLQTLYALLRQLHNLGWLAQHAVERLDAPYHLPVFFLRGTLHDAANHSIQTGAIAAAGEDHNPF